MISRAPRQVKFSNNIKYFHHWINADRLLLFALLHCYERYWDRPNRLTQCFTQFKSPGVKILCVAFALECGITFKWYGNSWNITFYSQRVWIGYNIELADWVYCPLPCLRMHRRYELTHTPSGYARVGCKTGLRFDFDSTWVRWLVTVLLCSENVFLFLLST